MSKYIVLANLTLVLFIAPNCFSQKATELYIPIGQSPGVSGKSSLLCEIDGLIAATNTLTVKDSVGTYSVTITDTTRIYLDNSQLRTKNAYGSAADLKTGSLAEIRFTDGETRQKAEWIKVQVKKPNSD